VILSCHILWCVIRAVVKFRVTCCPYLHTSNTPLETRFSVRRRIKEDPYYRRVFFFNKEHMGIWMGPRELTEFKSPHKRGARKERFEWTWSKVPQQSAENNDHPRVGSGRWVGLMVSALVSGSSGPCSSPSKGHCVVFLGKLSPPRSINGYRWI